MIKAMHTLIAAIHGIMTSQTDASWPDKFDAWMFERDPDVKVLKKEYRAGPFPRWNCWVTDPLLARSLAGELELFANPKSKVQGPVSSAQCSVSGIQCSVSRSVPIWFVAHSNGAVIALLAARRLIERGHRIGGLLLTGAACEADVRKNQILEWYCNLQLGAAIAYSSEEDGVVAGDPRAIGGGHPARAARAWLWGKLMWPYGCLGRTGWIGGTRRSTVQNGGIEGLDLGDGGLEWIYTRWYEGGHCGYFAPKQIETTFEQIYQDIAACNHVTM